MPAGRHAPDHTAGKMSGPLAVFISIVLTPVVVTIGDFNGYDIATASVLTVILVRLFDVCARWQYAQ